MQFGLTKRTGLSDMVLRELLCVAFSFLEIQTQMLVPTPTALRVSAHPCQESLQTVPLPQEAP